MAPASRGGTMRPVSPTTAALSPTSVARHGTPHAIASASVFGKPSPQADGKTNGSSARHQCRQIILMAQQGQSIRRQRRCKRIGKSRWRLVHPTAGQQQVNVRATRPAWRTASTNVSGSFIGWSRAIIPTSTAPTRDAQLLAKRGAHIGPGPIARAIKAVGNDDRVGGIINPAPILNRRYGRVVGDDIEAGERAVHQAATPVG